MHFPFSSLLSKTRKVRLFSLLFLLFSSPPSRARALSVRMRTLGETESADGDEEEGEEEAEAIFGRRRRRRRSSAALAPLLLFPLRFSPPGVVLLPPIFFVEGAHAHVRLHALVKTIKKQSKTGDKEEQKRGEIDLELLSLRKKLHPRFSLLSTPTKKKTQKRCPPPRPPPPTGASPG